MGQRVTVSSLIAECQVTISLVPEDLADFLRRHEEEYDAYDPTEDGIRDRSPSRGLGDVYKRQVVPSVVV